MNGKVFELSCAKCGSNRLRFPATDEEPVTCEDCGADGKSLHEVKVLMAAGIARTPDSAKGGAKGGDREERRKRHSSEVEASQAELRENVAETDRLVVASARMLRRHRKERDEEEGA